MKALITLLLLASPLTVDAKEKRQKYWVSPSSDFTFTWAKNGEVKVEAYFGGNGQVVYSAKLKKSHDGILHSTDGVSFEITNLAKPKTIDQGPKYTFTTNRKLTISGKSKAFKKLHRTFSGAERGEKTSPMVFYHDEIEMTSSSNR